MKKKFTIRILASCALLMLTGALAAKAQTPSRISFAKGKIWTTVTGTLAADAAKNFVARGRAGQELQVETNSRNLAVNLREGDTETTEDLGNLTADLNKNGDYVFELSNQSTRPIRFRMRVYIDDLRDVEP